MERFILLGWIILENKYCYYHNPRFKHLSDVEYDKVEEEYKALAITLNQTPSACLMVGFDFNKPSCMLVKSLVDSRKGITLKA